MSPKEANSKHVKTLNNQYLNSKQPVSINSMKQIFTCQTQFLLQHNGATDNKQHQLHFDKDSKELMKLMKILRYSLRKYMKKQNYVMFKCTIEYCITVTYFSFSAMKSISK